MMKSKPTCFSDRFMIKSTLVYAQQHCQVSLWKQVRVVEERWELSEPKCMVIKHSCQ
jgi:hypothetical protein